MKTLKVIELFYQNKYMQKKLYSSVGFIEDSGEYEEAGIPHVKMYKM